MFYLFSFLLEPVFSSFFAKLKQGKLLGCIVHNHQCALFGKAFHLEDERFFRHGAVHQQAVVDEDGGGVSGKAFRQCDGIGFDEVAVFRFLLLQPHAHVDKDDDYENHGKGKDAVCVAIFFIGHVRWFVLEGQQEGNDTTLFTIVCGLHETEYGYTSVKEMESVKVDGSKYGVDEIFQVEQLDGFKPVKLKSIPDEDLQTFLNRMEKK